MRVTRLDRPIDGYLSADDYGSATERAAWSSAIASFRREIAILRAEMLLREGLRGGDRLEGLRPQRRRDERIVLRVVARDSLGDAELAVVVPGDQERAQGCSRH